MKTSRRFIVSYTVGIVIFAIALLGSANAGMRLHGSVAPYLGPVATRTILPNGVDPTNKQFNSRSWHFARTAISSLKIAFANWTATESGIGGSGTVFASIEYPAATFTRVTWNSGATSISISDLTTALSDPVSVSIPNGAVFYVRFFYTGTAGAPYQAFNKDTARGDALSVAASGLSDQTMSGTITDSGTRGFWPAAVLGNTTQPTVAILGDSIAAGFGDAVDATGDIGSVARSIGGSYAYLNLACISDTANAFVATHSLRAALAQYASHVEIQYGTNDFFILHRTSANLLSDVSSIMGVFPSKGIVLTTIVPRTNSSDFWATTGNQTTVNSTDEASRVTYNTAVRAGISGAAHFAEIADVVENARNSGIWKAPGATADGIHPTPAMEQTLIGSTSTGWFSYP